MSTMYGIDLSKWNKVTDYKSIKEFGLDFAIIRAGGNYGGYYKDPEFEKHYAGCKNAGLAVGAYYDCGKEFIGDITGRDYANHFLKLLKDKQFDMPVFLDIEVTPKRFRTYITDAAIGFCERMEDNKYFVGIYASDISGFKEALEFNRLADYTTWVARYGKKPEYVKYPGIWQYTSNANIPGIKGNVDMDRTDVNYPFIIKRGKFNGY